MIFWLSLCGVALAAVLGAVTASLLACVPGLHVYNILALFVVGLQSMTEMGAGMSPDAIIGFVVGMVTAYSLVSTVPSVLLAAPDESALFTVLPGQKLLMEGRGYEAVLATMLGGSTAVLLLIFVLGPAASVILPVLRATTIRHQHWMVWCVVVFMVMSEWPKGGRLTGSGWRRLLAAWESVGAGLFTFLLSGLFEFILFYRSPVAAEAAFQNLMPAFVGLFTVPPLALALVSRVVVPTQGVAPSVGMPIGRVIKGVLAGLCGGGFAAFLPAVTGGVGGMLAGHATVFQSYASQIRSPKRLRYTGMFLNSGLAACICRIISRFCWDAFPQSRVIEPPSPPAPLTFHPIAPWHLAMSINCWAQPLAGSCDT